MNQPTSSYLYTNHLRFHYLHWNRDGGGRQILLLHGLASNARIWEMTAPFLAEAGYSLTAWEARGHGLSDKPEDGYDTPACISDLVAFIDACYIERPLIIGHSWGGVLAVEYAARFAIGPRAPAGIILVDGGFTQMDQRPGATWESLSQALAPPHLAGMQVDEFRRRLKDWTATWNASEQARDIILANFAVNDDETIAPHLSYERHMQILRSLWEYKTFERLPAVRCPALALPARPAVLRTDEERAFVENKRKGIQRAAQLLSHMQVHWLEDTIHDIPLQRPETLARLIIDFASSLP